ncbi:MAG: tRNA (adenosine(37)-N6)-threonylcarbamoyltransferase complex ATPase subunit type 1 TsaE [Spirochaetales bacterium]|nr:tRNA (adenosine(37)-N6)-threonylcarbamoyltransferase complex ATPase subunit type 1 TsaE [Spirochaetales bacterium]
MSEVFETVSLEETLDLGRKLAGRFAPGDVVALSGSLGAGKTSLVKGIALGLGIAEPVTSPTFTLIQEYEGRMPLYHVDLYRITDPDQLDDLGIEEYLDGNGVTVIEWPEKAGRLFPPRTLAVGITVLDGGRRRFEMEGKNR